MTPDQYHLCQLLPRCTYPPGSGDRLVARGLATYSPEQDLTADDAWRLSRLLHLHRGELGAALIPHYITDPALQQALRALCGEPTP